MGASHSQQQSDTGFVPRLVLAQSGCLEGCEGENHKDRWGPTVSLGHSLKRWRQSKSITDKNIG